MEGRKAAGKELEAREMTIYWAFTGADSVMPFHVLRYLMIITAVGEWAVIIPILQGGRWAQRGQVTRKVTQHLSS